MAKLRKKTLQIFSQLCKELGVGKFRKWKKMLKL